MYREKSKSVSRQLSPQLQLHVVDGLGLSPGLRRLSSGLLLGIGGREPFPLLVWCLYDMRSVDGRFVCLFVCLSGFLLTVLEYVGLADDNDFLLA